MNAIDIKFISSLKEQIEQYKSLLENNKNEQSTIDEKYRLLAEKEKNTLKVEEGVYQKMITVLDSSTIESYGKPASELVLEEKKEELGDLEELKRLKEQIDKDAETEVEEVVEESVDEVADEPNDVSDIIDDDNTSDEPKDVFADFDEWPDVDENFN